MKKRTLISVSISVSIAVLAAGVAISAQDKYTVKVPDGLGFSEFRGYEGWPVDLDQSERRHDRGDPGQSGDDRRL